MLDHQRGMLVGDKPIKLVPGRDGLLVVIVPGRHLLALMVFRKVPLVAGQHVIAGVVQFEQQRHAAGRVAGRLDGLQRTVAEQIDIAIDDTYALQFVT